MSSSNLKKSATIAQQAFCIMLAVSVSEIIAALLTNSVALLADGVHSISTSLIFFIVWIGLRLSGRSPDGTFHFGYYRVETLGSLIVAFVLAVFGGLILVESYMAWVQQRVITGAAVAIVVALASAVTTALTSFWVGRASRKYSSSALETGGVTGWIDVLSSVAVVIGVFLSTYLGILHADSIAGILITGAIFVAAYWIFKEASLVLVDACKCGDTINAIGEMAKTVKGIKEVHSIRMRRSGPYMSGDMHVVVDSNMPVKEADEIATKVEETITKEFGKIIDIKVRIESDIAHDHHSQEFIVKKPAEANK
jgi:cation diffusion facilitator family transporter